MNLLSQWVKKFFYLVRTGQINTALKGLETSLYSKNLDFGFRRDLTVPIKPPKARLEIVVRPLEERDIPLIFSEDELRTGDRDNLNLHLRGEFLKEGIPTCYVAARAEDDIPTYIQWLIGPAQNDRMQAYFNGLFPALKPDEVLVEQAYTLKAFRSKYIAPDAMNQIALKGLDLGARYALTFVGQGNTPALKLVERAGFHKYIHRVEQNLLFTKQVRFEPLGADLATR